MDAINAYVYSLPQPIPTLYANLPQARNLASRISYGPQITLALALYLAWGPHPLLHAHLHGLDEVRRAVRDAMAVFTYLTGGGATTAAGGMDQGNGLAYWGRKASSYLNNNNNNDNEGGLMAAFNSFEAPADPPSRRCLRAKAFSSVQVSSAIALRRSRARHTIFARPLS